MPGIAWHGHTAEERGVAWHSTLGGTHLMAAAFRMCALRYSGLALICSWPMACTVLPMMGAGPFGVVVMMVLMMATRAVLTHRWQW